MVPMYRLSPCADSAGGKREDGSRVGGAPFDGCAGTEGLPTAGCSMGRKGLDAEGGSIVAIGAGWIFAGDGNTDTPCDAGGAATATLQSKTRGALNKSWRRWVVTRTGKHSAWWWYWLPTLRMQGSETREAIRVAFVIILILRATAGYCRDAGLLSVVKGGSPGAKASVTVEHTTGKGVHSARFHPRNEGDAVRR